jgi:hypothetical protein
VRRPPAAALHRLRRAKGLITLKLNYAQVLLIPGL